MSAVRLTPAATEPATRTSVCLEPVLQNQLPPAVRQQQHMELIYLSLQPVLDGEVMHRYQGDFKIKAHLLRDWTDGDYVSLRQRQFLS